MKKKRPFWERRETPEARELLKYIPENYPVLGAEIGVRRAHTACGLLFKRPQLALILVDNWCEGEDCREATVENTKFAESRIFILDNDSTAAAYKFPNEAFDFVHIDADHSYDACLADCRAWWPKIKPFGFLAGHDIDNPATPGVRKAVEEFSREVKIPFRKHDKSWFMEKL
jgi:hypothetical protein